jgi:hypothetical protein
VATPEPAKPGRPKRSVGAPKPSASGEPEAGIPGDSVREAPTPAPAARRPPKARKAKAPPTPSPAAEIAPAGPVETPVDEPPPTQAQTEDSLAQALGRLDALLAAHREPSSRKRKRSS